MRKICVNLSNSGAALDLLKCMTGTSFWLEIALSLISLPLTPLVLLNAGCRNDEQVVEWLVKEHGVCVIPGSSCGVPGHIRVAFANLDEAACQKAADRLQAGLHQLVSDGMSAITAAAPKLATVS